MRFLCNYVSFLFIFNYHMLSNLFNFHDPNLWMVKTDVSKLFREGQNVKTEDGSYYPLADRTSDMKPPA